MNAGLLFVRLVYCFYVLFHLLKWFTFSAFLSFTFYWFVVFYACTQRSSIREVADFKAINCPPPQEFITCTDLEFTTSPAIAFIQCCVLPIFLIVCISVIYFRFVVRWLGGSFAKLGFSVACAVLQMCLTAKGRLHWD